MATLLGKIGREHNRYDSCAKIAFNRALDYLPESNFVYMRYNILCDEDSIAFNDSGIDKFCIDDCGVDVYSFKMTSTDGDLFMYHLGDYFWYVTIKCRMPSGKYNYVEFVFKESDSTDRKIYEF